MSRIRTEIDKLPDYDPAGVYQAFGQGRRVAYRPDLRGKEWDAFQKDYVLHHHITNGNIVSNLDLILNSGGSMAPTVDKLRRGVPLGGMSPERDLETGGASYFFTRITKADSAQRAQGICWKSRHAARLDAISYNSDEYGKVDDGELGILGRRRTGVAEWISAANHGSNETIFKNSLSLFDDIDRIVVAGSDYDAVLAVLRRHGYDKWPDGRELSEVIRKTK